MAAEWQDLPERTLTLVKRIHSRLVGVALDDTMPSALWVLKFSYLFGKRNNISLFILFSIVR